MHGIPRESPTERIPSPGRFVVKTPVQHATTEVRHRPSVLPASALALASSVFLKNEICDPSHLCISTTMGLVMPTRLKGVPKGIRDKVKPCTY